MIRIFTLIALVAFTVELPAAVTINTTFGVSYNSSGIPVSDGTLWALVVDHDVNNTFAGFGLGGSLYSANSASPGIADTFFTANQSISLGSVVGGGTVFAMGGINGGDGTTSNSVLLDLGVNGVAAGRNFAFYWFAGANFSGNQAVAQTISNQVGGIHNNTSDVPSIFETGMVVPSDGNTASVGAANIAAGGSIANNEFRSVTLIPEPSSMMLVTLGTLALLLRRRR